MPSSFSTSSSARFFWQQSFFCPAPPADPFHPNQPATKGADANFLSRKKKQKKRYISPPNKKP